MAITYYPEKRLKRKLRKRDLTGLITDGLRINRALLKVVSSHSVLSQKKVEEISLKVLKGYKQRVKEEMKLDDNLTRDDAVEIAMNKKKLIVQRIENESIYQVSQEIKLKYRGEKYEWLPSDANEADPEHQLNYGKIFTVGVGEMPNERYGCRCGMRILTDDEILTL